MSLLTEQLNQRITELTKEVARLRAIIEEAMGVIKNLADLHDSYISYLLVHNSYNEPAAKAINERIQELKAKIAKSTPEGGTK